MHELVLVEIIALPAERSRGRHNPRVVKRQMSGFPTKARAAPGPPCRRFRYSDHIRIIAPAADGAALPAPRLRPSPRQAEQASRRAFRRDHVRAWRESGLKRAAYAERHGLALRTLNHWIARLRHTFRRRPKADPAAA